MNSAIFASFVDPMPRLAGRTGFCRAFAVPCRRTPACDVCTWPSLVTHARAFPDHSRAKCPNVFDGWHIPGWRYIELVPVMRYIEWTLTRRRRRASTYDCGPAARRLTSSVHQGSDAMSLFRGNNGPRLKHIAEETAPYDAITVEKLTPVIGAEIGGVDLSRPLGNRAMEEIHRALAENLVIFFRDQHMSEDQHLAFGRSFGDLHLHPAAPHASGKPELMVIHANKDSPRANGEGWHSDVSCDEEPPMGSILYIRKCPPRGGDTLFASMYAAYEALSDRMKTYLDGLTAIHDGEH